MNKFRKSELYDPNLGLEITQFLDETIQNFAISREVLVDSTEKNNPRNIGDENVGLAMTECQDAIETMYQNRLRTPDECFSYLIDLYKIFAESKNRGFYQPGAEYIIDSLKDAQHLADRMGGDREKFIDEIMKMFSINKKNKRLFNEVNETTFKLAVISKLERDYWSFGDPDDWTVISRGLRLIPADEY